LQKSHVSFCKRFPFRIYATVMGCCYIAACLASQAEVLYAGLLCKRAMFPFVKDSHFGYVTLQLSWPHELGFATQVSCANEQQIAAHCNTLQHTTTHCSTLQHAATYCDTLQHTATHCSTLQHAKALCTTLQHSTLLRTFVRKSREKKRLPKMASSRL